MRLISGQAINAPTPIARPVTRLPPFTTSSSRTIAAVPDMPLPTRDIHELPPLIPAPVVIEYLQSHLIIRSAIRHIEHERRVHGRGDFDIIRDTLKQCWNQAPPLVDRTDIDTLLHRRVRVRSLGRYLQNQPCRRRNNLEIPLKREHEPLLVGAIMVVELLDLQPVRRLAAWYVHNESIHAYDLEGPLCELLDRPELRGLSGLHAEGLDKAAVDLRRKTVGAQSQNAPV